MPKIPMLDVPVVQHTRGSVPMSGAPGMNFKLEEGQGVINLGKTIAGSGEQIGNAIGGVLTAREKLAAQQRYTDDRLNAAKVRNLYRDINNGVEVQMAEHPESYESFPMWTEDADKRFMDEAQPLLSKMSPEFRKMFDVELDGIRRETLHKRTLFSVNAGNTARYNEFQVLWKDAAMRGDLAEAERLLDEFNDILISNNAAKQYRLDFNRMSEFGEVKQLIDAGDVNIIDLLNERNDDGSYRNFTALSLKDRAGLLRAAEDRDATRRSDENLALYERLNSGEVVTEEEIREGFRNDASLAGRKQMSQQLDMVRRFNLTRMNAAEKARLSNAQQGFDRDVYEVSVFSFDADPKKAQGQYEGFRKRFQERYSGDGGKFRQLMGYLDARYRLQQEKGFDRQEYFYSNYDFSSNPDSSAGQYNFLAGQIREDYKDNIPVMKRMLSVLDARYQAHRKDLVNHDEYRILSYNFPSDGDAAKKDYFGMKNYILHTYTDDPATVKRLIDQLESSYSRYLNPNGNYKNTYNYKMAFDRLESMRESFGFRGSSKMFSFQSKTHIDYNYSRAAVLLDEYLKRHPDADQADIEKWLNNLKDTVNQQDVNNLIQFWWNARPENFVRPGTKK